jgi:hypothetical protein
MKFISNSFFVIAAIVQFLRYKKYLSNTQMSSQLVNPAVLTSHSTPKPYKQMYRARFTERYGTLPVSMSTSPAYAAHQPPTSQVAINRITRNTDPHLGSLEYYSSGRPGIQILRRYNNLFIPQIPS